jgi:hypothetical protein
MSFEIKLKPSVLLFFNLSAMDDLEILAHANLDPIIENEDGTVQEPTVDSCINGRNGPQTDLELIGELTTIWMRTIEEHPAIAEGINVFKYREKGSAESKVATAFYAFFDNVYDAERFKNDMEAQPHSFRIKQAYGRKIKLVRSTL